MDNCEYLKGICGPSATAEMPRSPEATDSVPSARGGAQKGALCPSLS